jgi:hypothetical protein
MWECSEHGVPRLINKICKLSLKAGETNELAEINGEIIQQIGDRFQKMTRPAGAKRKQRKRHENEATPEPVKELQDNHSEEPIEPVVADETKPEPVLHLQNDREIPDCTDETTKEESAVHDGIEQKIGMFPEGVRFADERTCPEDTMGIEENEDAGEVIHYSTVKNGRFPDEVSYADEQTYLGDTADNEEKLEGVDIGGQRFQVDISSSLIEQARTSDPDQRNKMAGTIAAQALKDNSELTKAAASADPVPIWNEIKKFVLCKISR